MDEGNCIVCGSDSLHYFFKIFQKLGNVEYMRCRNCGFVFSITHKIMSVDVWNELNQNYHSYHNSGEARDDKNWLSRMRKQVRMVNELSFFGVIPNGKWIDYGCGDGKFCEFLKEESGKTILNYDLYPCNEKILYLNNDDLVPKSFDFVINTSVLEHVRHREEINKLFNLVSDNGAIALHTYVGKEIPRDPNWFYLLPVHCAFFTNESMRILFNEFGFKSSLYCVENRMWILSKLDIEFTSDFKSNFIYYRNSKGFMDYWK
jgi:hypothetical protein